MMSEEPGSKPRIVVDDDWKERVQAEKEILQKQAEEKRRQSARTELPPPASFPILVTSLATQALSELRQITDTSGKPRVRLDHARHVIDMLGMLEEKTRGNLTREESSMLRQVLHELRMAYVAVSNRPPEAAAKA